MSEDGKDIVEEILNQEGLRHASNDLTVQDVYDAMTDDQKSVVHYFVGLALQENNQAPA